jgi:hypothetical protein
LASRSGVATGTTAAACSGGRTISGAAIATVATTSAYKTSSCTWNITGTGTTAASIPCHCRGIDEKTLTTSSCGTCGSSGAARANGDGIRLTRDYCDIISPTETSAATT